mgnify:CR=1 FL=1
MFRWAVGFGRSALGNQLWVKFKKNLFSLLAHSPQLIVHSVFAFFLLSSNLTSAQCAMCRAALESEESGIKAEAVNDGIVYLMIIPYVLVAVLFYFIYRLRKKNK